MLPLPLGEGWGEGLRSDTTSSPRILHLIIALLFILATGAHASDLAFVTVGDPGNPPCPLNGKGAVAYPFEMGACEITNTQYAEFLNAVAVESDPYRLYAENMGPGLFGGICRIEEDGRVRYQPIEGFERRPVVYVSWSDAARFCNWLHYGRTEGTASEGAYDTTNPKAVRNKDARYALPTFDEWIKAAYYDPKKNDNAGYWRYPVKTDTKPKCVPPPGTADAANYFDGRWAAPEPYLTEAGAYANAKSPYGTYDQGGNVMEWVESAVGPARRGIIGGDATKFDYALRIDYADAELPDQALYIVGFRVVRLEASHAQP